MKQLREFIGQTIITLANLKKTRFDTKENQACIINSLAPEETFNAISTLKETSIE